MAKFVAYPKNSIAYGGYITLSKATRIINCIALTRDHSSDIEPPRINAIIKFIVVMPYVAVFKDLVVFLILLTVFSA